MKKLIKLTTAFLAVSSVALVASPSQSAELGGLNLDGFCRSIYGSKASSHLIQGQGASGWRCKVGNTLYTFSGRTDMHSACKWQYRRSDAMAQPRNWSDPYSWRCYGQNVLVR